MAGDDGEEDKTEESWTGSPLEISVNIGLSAGQHTQRINEAHQRVLQHRSAQREAGSQTFLRDVKGTTQQVQECAGLA